jgi:hypothetical protein
VLYQDGRGPWRLPLAAIKQADAPGTASLGVRFIWVGFSWKLGFDLLARNTRPPVSKTYSYI